MSELTPEQVFMNLETRVSNVEATLRNIQPMFEFFKHHEDALTELFAGNPSSRLSALETHASQVPSADDIIAEASKQATSTMYAQIAEVKNIVNDFRRDGQATWATKAELRHEVKNIQNSNQSSTKPTFEKIKYPVPEAFTGKREDWKTFSNHLALYFKAHESLYTSSTDKILFAISRLGSGPAFKYMQNYIPLFQKPPAEQPGIITNYDLFIKTMAEHFGQQNAHLIAEVQMRQLHQKGSALDYTNKFMELAADVNWNDDALIAQYRMGLKDSVQDTMGQWEEPKTFAAFREKAIDIDKRQYARHLAKQQNSSTPSARSNPMLSNRTISSTSRPTLPPASAQTQPTAHHQPPTMPMDLSQARHLTNEQKQHRKDTNACYYCGDTTHWSNKCPKKPVLASATNDYTNDDFALTFELEKGSA
jgi:Retrotransposon gag protein